MSNQQIDKILDGAAIQAIQDEFASYPNEMAEILQETLPSLYDRAEPLVDAIAQISQQPVPSSPAGLPNRLSTEDRERIILALLASRGGGYTLAIHVYLALILNITPAEIANILLLTGIYTGISNFTNCLFELEKTLGMLRDRIDSGKPLNPRAIDGALRQAFPVL
jgi:alkylhydroperoxidase/carboxymuconolactone decarboxylase family protein YurZ